MSTDELADAISRAILDRPENDTTEPSDHLEIVRRAAQAHDLTRSLLQQAVGSARSSGHSWAAIGGVLGLSRQAVQQRFGASAPSDDDTELRHLGPVTAFDEMAELELAGRQGWHTVAAGILHHQVVHTSTQWQHRRVMWVRPAATYETDGWKIGAKAFPWLYLIRDTQLPAEPTSRPS